MKVEAFFKVSYGLYLITTGTKNKQGGYIANVAFQVTSSPPRFGISCHNDNYSSQIIRNNGNFAISVLNQDTSPKFIGDFGYNSSRDYDKFRGKNYFRGKTGVPIVADSVLAWFECKLHDFIEVGTHTIFIGEVIDYDLIEPEATPLTYKYYREVKKSFSPKNSPTYIKEEKLMKEEYSNNGTKSIKEEWTCEVCKYIYESSKGDEISGIPPGTLFKDLPDNWVCPVCGSTKDNFIQTN